MQYQVFLVLTKVYLKVIGHYRAGVALIFYELKCNKKMMLE